MLNWGIRNVPQVMRHYILINSLRAMNVAGMMDYCNNYPLLTKIKRMLLHDKEAAHKEITFYRKQIRNGTFHFRYKSPKEMGRKLDISACFEEDLAGISYNTKMLIQILKELDEWIDSQPDYRYPAEINS